MGGENHPAACSRFERLSGRWRIGAPLEPARLYPGHRRGGGLTSSRTGAATGFSLPNRTRHTFRTDPPHEYYEKFLDPGFRPSLHILEHIQIVRSKMLVHPPGVVSAMEAGQQDTIGKADESHERSVGVVQLEPEDTPGIVALYDGEVRVFDDLVGRWVNKLADLGLLDETLIVITADHAEELMERGRVGHSSCNLHGTLYDESIIVPLILYGPRVLPRGRVVENQVSQIDVMPTLMALLGLPMPPGERRLLPHPAYPEGNIRFSPGGLRPDAAGRVAAPVTGRQANLVRQTVRLQTDTEHRFPL